MRGRAYRGLLNLSDPFAAQHLRPVLKSEFPLWLIGSRDFSGS